MSEQTPSNSRQSIRFTPDPKTLAQVDLMHVQMDEPFDPQHIGLVVEEAFKGCGLVLVVPPEISANHPTFMAIGSKFRLTVGYGPVMQAEVRWRRQLDPQVIRIGVMYF
jgi:hypothetical protein